MGASTSIEKNVTVEKKLYDAYMIKYNDNVRELISVKKHVSDLQEELKAKASELDSYKIDNAIIEQQIKTTEQTLIDTQEKLENTKRLLGIELQMNNHNYTWRTKYESLVKTSDSYSKDLSEKEQKLNYLNQQNVKLQTDNIQLKKELEEVTQQKSMLNEEIQKKEFIYNDEVNKLKTELNKASQDVENVKLEYNMKLRNELEEELKKKYNAHLKELEEKLVKETVTDEILRKIIQIYHRIEELQNTVSIKRDIMMNKIKAINYDDKEKLIENFKSDYDIYEKTLASKNISTCNKNFIDAYAKYKHVSLRNGDTKKNVFWQVYQIENSIKNFRKKFNTFARELSKTVETNERCDKDLNMQLLLQGLDTEEELYQDVLKMAKETVEVWKEYLDIDKNKYSRKVYDSSGTSISVDSKSLILFNAMENKHSENEDYLMVSMFLNKNRIVEKNVIVRRLGKSCPNFNRPLIVHFTNRYCVDRILQLSKNPGWFDGYNPSVSRF